jgi:hypothetical protein
MALSPELQRRERLLNHYCTLESEVSKYTATSYEAAVDVGKVLLRRGHAGSRFDFKGLGKSRVDGFIYQLSPKELLPHWAFRLAMLAKARLRPPRGPQRYVVVTFCEQPPRPDSRVFLGKGAMRSGCRDWWSTGGSATTSAIPCSVCTRRSGASSGSAALAGSSPVTPEPCSSPTPRITWAPPG